MISVEQATVYRGGGRRWFSRKAAVHAEANAVFRARFKSRCECSDAEYGRDGQLLSPTETCFYHEGEYRGRFVRRVARLLAAIAKEPKP